MQPPSNVFLPYRPPGQNVGFESNLGRSHQSFSPSSTGFSPSDDLPPEDASPTWNPNQRPPLFPQLPDPPLLKPCLPTKAPTRATLSSTSAAFPVSSTLQLVSRARGELMLGCITNRQQHIEVGELGSGGPSGVIPDQKGLARRPSL